VDILPVKAAKDLAAYRGVILGSAVYTGNWRKEAANFLKENEKNWLSGRCSFSRAVRLERVNRKRY
jgi:menaquinone-dependent protoporphyrinogen IX oxidase